MLVKDIMTKNIVSINSNDSVLEACKRYNRYKIGCLIVTDQNKIIGIVTERDIIFRIIVQGKDPFNTTIEEIMSKNIITISPNADVKEAAEIMGEKQIKKLPVKTETGELAGIITITDIANIIPNFLKILAEGGDNEAFKEAANKFLQLKT